MSATDRSRAGGVYLVIALLGLAVVLGPLLAWLGANGLDLRLALAELTATGMTTAAFMDLIYGVAYPDGCFDFTAEEPLCRAKGDPYCEFVARKSFSQADP